MKFIFVLFLILASPGAFAVTLSWEECLRATAQGNESLLASRQDWLAVQMNERAAFAGYLPRLSASTSVTQTGSTGASGGSVVSNGVVLNTSGTGSQVATNYLAALNFSQNIFNGLEDRARIEQAQWRSQNSFWAYESAKAQASFSLKEAYANLLFAQESVALAESVLERRESNSKLVSVRYQNGRENKGSVLLAEAYLEQARLDLIRARDSVTVATERIKAVMNKEHLASVEVSGDVPLPVLPEAAPLTELVLQTPVYHQALAVEKVAHEDVKIVRGAFLPNLDLTAQAVRQGPSYFPERERWAVALTLTIPLFDGVKDLAGHRGATFARAAAEGRKRNTALELLPRLRDALTQAKQSDLKYSIDEKFRRASGTRAEIAREKYNNGLISFEDWDIIENELIQRQTAYLQSKRDRTLRYATWENLLGKGAIP